MPNMIAAATTPTIVGLNRLSLLEQFGLATGLLTFGTVTSGDVSYFIDTNQLKSTQHSPADWEGGWARISSSTDNAAPEGEYRPIIQYEPELGRVRVNPNFTAAPAANDTYELWRVNPFRVLELIDKVLQHELFMPCWTVLSEIPDHDMEQTHTTDWTASGATVTKQSGEPRMSGSGKNYLRVVSVSAGDYARSAILRVEPGKTYHASAVVRCSAANTTAKLVVYDETNGAVIDSWISNRLYPVRIAFNYTTPSTCYSISYRLTNVEASVTTEWDEVVGFGLNSSDISLPWWVKDRGQVKGIFQYNYSSIAEKLWDVTLTGEVDRRWDVHKHFGGGNKFKAVARRGQLVEPLYILGTRNETAYSAETTDYKYVDLQLFLSCLKYRVYEYLVQPLESGILEARNFKEEFIVAKAEYDRIKQEQAEELNKTIQSPTPMGLFIDDRFTYGG